MPPEDRETRRVLALGCRLYPSMLTSTLSASKTGAFIDADNLVVSPHLRHLYAYLAENRFIEPIRGYNADLLPIYARDVLARIGTNDPAWETMVPAPVAEIIRRRNLWGCAD